MDKKSIASGVAAVALATTLAVTPAVTDLDEAKSVEIVEDVVSEESIEDVTVEEKKAEKKETEEKETEDIETEEVEEEPAESESADDAVTEPPEHLEAEPPNYDDYITEIGYSFSKASERSKTLIIDVPDFLSADIATMYVNGSEVGTTLLPTEAKFTTIPVVFEDLSNIEIKLYRMGEEIGSARFIDDILRSNAKAVE